MTSGSIYVLSHPRMPGLVKIGYTTTCVLKRVASLSSETSCPGSFQLVAEFDSSDPPVDEQRVFEALKDFRFRRNREFFELNADLASRYIKEILDGTRNQRLVSATQHKVVTKTTEVGGLIRRTRKARGWKQSDLADAANTGLRFIVDLEAGKETTQFGKVLSVLSSLGINILMATPTGEPDIGGEVWFKGVDLPGRSISAQPAIFNGLRMSGDWHVTLVEDRAEVSFGPLHFER